MYQRLYTIYTTYKTPDVLLEEMCYWNTRNGVSELFVITRETFVDLLQLFQQRKLNRLASFISAIQNLK